MHPFHHAKSRPDHPAYTMAGTGEVVTFRQLDERSNQIAHALREAGCQPGDTIALFAENSPRYFEVCWAAQRSGLYFVCISSRLTTPEVQYIIEDSGAKLLIADAHKSAVAQDVKSVTTLERGLPIDADNVLVQICRGLAGVTEDSIYLSPAPLYHAAPLRWSMTMTKLGASLVIMEKFDPEN